jgi:hypothetical protein
MASIVEDIIFHYYKDEHVCIQKHRINGSKFWKGTESTTTDACHCSYIYIARVLC